MVNLYSCDVKTNNFILLFAVKKSPEPLGTLACCFVVSNLFYLIITGCVVVFPAPFMRTMYWPFGMSARLNM